MGDALRLKKYFGWAQKTNKNKKWNEFMKAMKAPLENLFYDHTFCGKWCKQKKHLQQQAEAEQANKKQSGKKQKRQTQPQALTDTAPKTNATAGTAAESDGNQPVVQSYYRSKKEQWEVYEFLKSILAPYMTE